MITPSLYSKFDLELLPHLLLYEIPIPYPYAKIDHLN